jgi:hypothetical protein
MRRAAGKDKLRAAVTARIRAMQKAPPSPDEATQEPAAQTALVAAAALDQGGEPEAEEEREQKEELSEAEGLNPPGRGHVRPRDRRRDLPQRMGEERGVDHDDAEEREPAQRVEGA